MSFQHASHPINALINNEEMDEKLRKISAQSSTEIQFALPVNDKESSSACLQGNNRISILIRPKETVSIMMMMIIIFIDMGKKANVCGVQPEQRTIN